MRMRTHVPATWLLLVALLALLAGAAAFGMPAAASADADTETNEASRIRIVILPADTTFGELQDLGLGSVGYLGAAQHKVEPLQVFLDISQGSRSRPGAYNTPVSDLAPGAYGTGEAEGPSAGWWRTVLERADEAGLPGQPGLLAAELGDHGWELYVGSGESESTWILVGRDGPGAVDGTGPCPSDDCLSIAVMTVEELETTPPESDEMVIAFAAPTEGERIVPILVAGPAYPPGGTIRSGSTRMDGLVISTDITATVLEAAGIDPNTAADGEAIEGEPIRPAEGTISTAIESIAERLDSIEKRRGSVIGTAVLAWLVGGLGMALLMPSTRRPLALILAISVVLLPTVLLVTAVLRPVPGIEFLIVVASAPLAAWLLCRIFRRRPLLAYSTAAAISVGVLAVDMIAGSVVTPFSLLGSNPAYGARFYGIGNELEATIACLVPLGTAAALASFTRTRRGGLVTVAAFLGVGAAAAVVFAASRWGADVGAAMVVPAGVAVAAAASIQDRRVWLAAGAAMVLGLVALIVSDLLLEGDSHFSRTVLDAGSPGRVFEVLGRRLEMTAESFARPSSALLLLGVFAAAVVGWTRRRTIQGWFVGRRSAWAGCLGAIAASLVGTVLNDSGALFLLFGAVFVGGYIGAIWATSADRNGREKQ